MQNTLFLDAKQIEDCPVFKPLILRYNFYYGKEI